MAQIKFDEMDSIEAELNAACPLVFYETYEPSRVSRFLSGQQFMSQRNAWEWTICVGLRKLKEGNTDHAEGWSERLRAEQSRAERAERRRRRDETADALGSAGRGRSNPVEESAVEEFVPPDTYEGSVNEAIIWAMGQEDTVLFIPDWWTIRKEDDLVSLLADVCGEYGIAKANGSSVILVGPGIHSMIPEVLENDSVMLKAGLPSQDRLLETVRQLTEVAISAVPSAQKDRVRQLLAPTEEEQRTLAMEAHGLTTSRVETMLARNFAATGRFDVSYIRAEAQKIVEQIGPLKIMHPEFSFADVGGFDAAKEYMRVLASESLPVHLAAKMILFLGIPGSGKSMIAYALANELGWESIELDFGAAMNKYVGESERTLRATLDYLSSKNRAVVVVDEIEKMFAGSGTENTGVTTRLLGQFLTWNQNRKNRILLVATANDVSGLPPELFRAGRVDKSYFVGEPDGTQLEQIKRLKAAKYEVPQTEMWPNMTGWSGAEIEQLTLEYARYRAAGMPKPLMHLAPGIMPVTRKMGSKLAHLKQFAAQSCTCAHTGMPYSPTGVVRVPDASGTIPPPPPGL